MAAHIRYEIAHGICANWNFQIRRSCRHCVGPILSPRTTLGAHAEFRYDTLITMVVAIADQFTRILELFGSTGDFREV